MTAADDGSSSVFDAVHCILCLPSNSMLSVKRFIMAFYLLYFYLYFGLIVRTVCCIIVNVVFVNQFDHFVSKINELFDHLPCHAQGGIFSPNCLKISQNAPYFNT